MSDSIELSTLIDRVKRDLLSDEEVQGDPMPYLFGVDEVVLELKVNIRKEARGGVKVYIAELGGGGSRDDSQTIRVTLTPLISREQRLELLQNKYPEEYEKTVEASVRALSKGSDSGIDDVI